MNIDDLKNLILSLTRDIEFRYNDAAGVISPYSDHEFNMGFRGDSKDYDNIDELITDPFYDGKSLNEISNQITLQ